MYLKAGDLVVCISTKPNPSYQPDPWTLVRLQEGAYYRVASYVSGIAITGRRIFGVTLVGVDHAPGHGWQAWRFRKVVSAEPSFEGALRRREPSQLMRTEDTGADELIGWRPTHMQSLTGGAASS